MTWDELYAACEKLNRDLLSIKDWSVIQGLDVQALNLAEEVGEFVGAYRRWTDRARRPGTHHEMAEELADVVITAFVMAHRAQVDLPGVVRDKLLHIGQRGLRDPRLAASVPRGPSWPGDLGCKDEHPLDRAESGREGSTQEATAPVSLDPRE